MNNLPTISSSLSKTNQIDSSLELKIEQGYNKIMTTTNKNMTYSYITNWLPKAEAQAKVKALIADGTYQKGQIKLSSYRWADLKDHSKGYVARVHVITGIHPELELGLTGKKKKAQKAEAQTAEEVPAEQVEFTKTKVQYHDCLQDGETVQVIEIEADMTAEQIELLQTDHDGQGHEIALSLAEDFNIDQFNRYELVA